MQRLFAAAACAALLSLGACSPPQEAKAPESQPAATEPAPATEAAVSAEAIPLEITDASGAQLSGDPARGERIFAQCTSCHSLDQGVNRVGPSLHGVIGRRAGSIEGFQYSDANRNSGVTWSEQELFGYLENPRTRIPGTIMAYAGLRNPQQRADLIAYLKQNTGG